MDYTLINATQEQIIDAVKQFAKASGVEIDRIRNIDDDNFTIILADDEWKYDHLNALMDYCTTFEIDCISNLNFSQVAIMFVAIKK